MRWKVLSKEYPPNSLFPSIQAVRFSTPYPKAKENVKVGLLTIKIVYYTFDDEAPSNHLKVTEA